MEKITQRLDTINATPNKNLGQHFLINQDAITFLEENVTPGGIVIEIGAGVGQITEALAKNAGHVFALELDKRYQPILDTVATNNPNVSIAYENALHVDYTNFLKNSPRQTVQIIASLPYHITEPFMFKAIHLPIHEMILITGKNFSDAIAASVHDANPNYSLLSLLVNTFYDVTLERELEKTDFFPPPRTKSAILRFTPHQEEYFDTQQHFLLRRLFFSGGGLIKNMLRDGFIAFADKERNSHQGNRRNAGQHILTKNDARAMVEQLALPESVLEKSLSQLTQQELIILAKTLSL